jgi:hypothetical protein
MMHPDRSVSVSVGIVVPAGAAFDPSHHWISQTSGRLCCSVSFDAGQFSYGHIQGEPAALRELAAALVQAAELAEHSQPTLAAGPSDRDAPASVGGAR